MDPPPTRPGLSKNEACAQNGSVEEELVYEKLPKDISDRHVLLMDPILGTGNTASRAIQVMVLPALQFSLKSIHTVLENMDRHGSKVFTDADEVVYPLIRKGRCDPNLLLSWLESCTIMQAYISHSS